MDTDILLKYIRGSWIEEKTLSLEQLQQKTLVLLCLATMVRPRSDIGRLRYEDVTLNYTTSNRFSSTILHFREAKETQVKSVTLGIIEAVNLCSVRKLKKFLLKTSLIRETLPKEHIFFLANIIGKAKVASVRPSTVAS